MSYASSDEKASGLKTPPIDQLSPPASDASDDERLAVPSTGGRKKVSNKWEKADGVKHADGAIPDDYVTRTL